MKIKKILITGGVGFLGGYLIRHLLKTGQSPLVVFDRLLPDESYGGKKRVTYEQGDITDANQIARLFRDYGPFDVVYHLASAMPNKAVTDEVTRRTNVEGTANVARAASGQKTRSFVFTSSNVTYGIPAALPVTEETPVQPLEVYGASKLDAEKELAKFKGAMDIQIFRCPVITGVGRLGLQSILYEFISENKNVYMLGDGSNRYQFVDAADVCDALVKSSSRKGFDVYVIGGDGVMTLSELYSRVIAYAGSTSKIVALPKAPSLATLVILDRLNISPLGVYQYTMISRSIYADTKKLKSILGWKPRKTNLDSFIENYRWYVKNKESFKVLGNSSLSANRSLPKMGIFKLLKLLS